MSRILKIVLTISFLMNLAVLAANEELKSLFLILVSNLALAPLLLSAQNRSKEEEIKESKLSKGHIVFISILILFLFVPAAFFTADWGLHYESVKSFFEIAQNKPELLMGLALVLIMCALTIKSWSRAIRGGA